MPKPSFPTLPWDEALNHLLPSGMGNPLVFNCTLSGSSLSIHSHPPSPAILVLSPVSWLWYASLAIDLESQEIGSMSVFSPWLHHPSQNALALLTHAFLAGPGGSWLPFNITVLGCTACGFKIFSELSTLTLITFKKAGLWCKSHIIMLFGQPLAYATSLSLIDHR